MTPAVFAILVILADRDLYGYAILQEVEYVTSGSIRLTPGTLYRSLQRMRTSNLIEELASDGAGNHAARCDPSSSPSGGRRRIYRITSDGRLAVREEAHRLAHLVRAAESVGVIGVKCAVGERFS